MSYDQYAQTFSKSRQHHPWPELEYIIEDMIHRKVQSVLDIGCGNGRFLEEIHHVSFAVHTYLGIDSSQGMIDEAKRLHPEYSFEVCDMRTIHHSPFTIHHFDSLLLLASFHHLETYEVRLQVLRDMKLFLKP